MPGKDNSPEDQADVTRSTVGAAAMGLFGAWIAAGSTGILAEPLRVALTWFALGLAAALAPPKWHWRPVLCIGVMAVLPMFARTGPVHEVLMVAAFLALLADGCSNANRKVLLLCSWATLTFGIYAVACRSIPSIWLLANSLGDWMGHVTGVVTGQPLTVGAAFGGIDFLVLMAAFYFGWLANTQGPRFPRAALAAFAILLGHFLYLSILTLAPAMAESLPTLPPPTFQHPYVPPAWDWAEALRQLLPWNLPVLGALIQVTIACFMLRWARWQPTMTEEKQRDARSALERTGVMERTGTRLKLACPVPIMLAAAFAVSSALSWGGTPLRGKVLVANQQGHLDWLKPRHDHYGQPSAGQFGMLPVLVESLGGRLDVSPDPEEDLANCDVLLLLHPTNPLSQARQDRIWDFVRRGGALLLVASPIDQPGGWISRYNELLSPTAIRIREDVAISETGNWQHACQTLAHPATTAVNPRDGSLFSDTGASLQISWPARPLIVGRWGWSDPGSDAVLSGVYRWEAGERLGDLVLAAEQPFGKGSVVVLGDGFNLTSEGLVRGYDWAGRLLSYLASKGGSPAATWRQVVSFLLCLALLAALCRYFDPWCLLGAALVLAVSLAMCGSGSQAMTRVVPDGRLIENQSPGSSEENESLSRFRGSKLAYLDASHLEAYSNRNWAFDAVNGLALNLMRSGFLPLMLPSIDQDHLERAAIIVSMAPARRFSRKERRRLNEFVHGGGILICTTGAEEARASQPLLADFGLRVPRSPVPTAGKWREPEPMGNFRSLFLDASDYDAGNYKVGVTFHAGWPVEVTDEESGEESEVLVYGQNDVPIVVCRHVGQGKVVLIGDTGFAMNKNLEYFGGEPFAGGYENAHFWRWLISRITDKKEWIPPPAEPEADNPEADNPEADNPEADNPETDNPETREAKQ